MEDSFDYLGWYGATLSTLTAIASIYYWYSRKTKLYTSYSFTGNPYDDDRIEIINKGDEAIVILYWQFYWKERKWFGKKHYFNPFDIEEIGTTILQGNSKHILNFPEQYKFSFKKDVDLYLELTVGNGSKKRLLIMKD